MRNPRVIVIVEVGLSVALAAVLNTFKVFDMPQGGTVSLVMLPLFVLALRRGPWAGVLAGALYGIVDVLIDPFVVHWAQFLLDYPVAYALVGTAGFLAPALRSVDDGRRPRVGRVTAIIAGVALGSLLRYLSHVASGVVFFSEFAQGQPVLVYSAAYNSFVWVSAILCAAAALVLVPALERAVPVRRA